MFIVEDTGIGIKEEDKGKLFRLFGKLEQYNQEINSTGIGMGLTICNKILNQLGAHLELTSIYGRGTLFSFILDVGC